MYRMLIDEVAALDDGHKQMLLDGYRCLFSDRVMAQEEIAELAAALPYVVCEAGQVMAIFGLDRRPCAHQLTINGVRRYTWCIWDAFFIAEALGEDALIETVDPVSQQSLSAQFVAGRWQVEGALWASFPVQKNSGAALRSAFCRFVHLFADHGNALAYQQMHGCVPEPVFVLLARSREMAVAMQPSQQKVIRTA
ncbi:alkylmercury lyase family protein [Cardiobacteriaceae bacterium TAE3-ERU3]|nr:alkylmercury lyase family protein [Cardiobacteriaceae bacterium TAE3-ERU3]